jgi:hypothetical protein
MGLFIATTPGGYSIQDLGPNPTLVTQKPVFALDGTLTSLTYYQTENQITANRIAEVQMTYDDDLNPVTEVTQIFDLNDGTTVVKTITKTYTFEDGVLTNASEVFS